MLLESQDVFFLFFPFSKLDNVSSPIVSQSSQSHIHHVRRMSLNSNQGKIIFFFKRTSKVALKPFWTNLLPACAQLTVQSSDWPIAVI